MIFAFNAWFFEIRPPCPALSFKKAIVISGNITGRPTLPLESYLTSA